MKIKRNVIILSALVFIAVLLTSCALLTSPPKETGNVTDEEYLEVIARLEAEIDELRALQRESEESSKIPLTGNDSETAVVTTAGTTDTGENAAEQSGTYYYIIENDKVTVTKYVGSESDVTVPEKLDGKIVAKIGEHAFEGNKSLRSVSLPETVSEIDWFAFYNCGALERVYLPASLSKIGYSVFDGCSGKLCFVCEKGSYAEKFVQSYGMKYENQD